MQAPDKLDLVCDEVVYDNNAQEVFKKLEDLDNQRDLLVSRWIWELLQNARGLAGSQQQLKVEVALSGGYLTFRHNGPPFEEREIAHLIFHGSTKHNPRDIGRFGTGFITTHLISRRVRVRGSLSDGRPFDFELNREGKDALELRAAMDLSKDQLRMSLSQAPPKVPDPYTTEYIYPVGDPIRDVVAKGIQALTSSASYIFAFNPMLHRLRISTVEASIEMAQEPLEPLQPNTRRLALTTNGQDSSQWLVATCDEDVAAAILVEVKNGTASVQLPVGVARLFLAFPLNGTDTLCIPLVLNSELFAPREDRDGIYLGVAQNDANLKNMDLFTAGCQRIITLASLAAQQDWPNAANVTYLQPSPVPKWVKESWLRTQIREVLIEGFRTAPLLRTVSQKPIPPSSAWIPVAQGAAPSIELWQASEPLLAAADLIPRLTDQEAWERSVTSWTHFLEPTNDKLNEIWTVDRLAGRLEGLKSITGATAALREKTPVLAWLNQVHALICKADSFDLFRKKCLIPNERGDLALLGKLAKDAGIDTALKDIAELLGIDVRAQLVHPEIITKDILDSLGVLTQDQLLSQLLDAMRQCVREKKLDVSFQQANVQLFAWLLKKDKTDKLEAFPALAAPDQAGSCRIIFLSANTPLASKLLAPVARWDASAKTFADLLPEPAILNPRYAAASTDASPWLALAVKGFILSNPLYEADSTVDEFLPDEPLSDEEAKAKPRSEVAQRRTELAWLSAILDRVRGSQARAVKFLKFLIDYVLPADPQAFNVVTTKCENGKDHHFYRANWIGLVRARRWVPQEGDKRFTASAHSLAKLLEHERDLLKRLSEERVSELLEKLGVSPADLMLQSVGRDDPERMSLIQSVAVIKSAVGDDPEKVKALAGAIQEDRELITIAEQRQARRETVKRNQALGDLVERLFVEAFRDTGLAVKRTGPGHDYRVEADIGEEEDAAQLEITNPAGSVFVEIKATTGTGARMSVKQVGQAVLHKDRYFLCVMAVSGPEPDAEAFKAQAKFVVDIGERLQNLWAECASIEATLDSIPKTEGGLTVEVSGHKVQLRVDEQVWRTGTDFPTALEALKTRLLPT